MGEFTYFEILLLCRSMKAGGADCVKIVMDCVSSELCANSRITWRIRGLFYMAIGILSEQILFVLLFEIRAITFHILFDKMQMTRQVFFIIVLTRYSQDSVRHLREIHCICFLFLYTNI